MATRKALSFGVAGLFLSNPAEASSNLSSAKTCQDLEAPDMLTCKSLQPSCEKSAKNGIGADTPVEAFKGLASTHDVYHQILCSSAGGRARAENDLPIAF